ncbi:MAG: DUF1275 domain-containing protein [Firmicutes bacterium]|jgi:uncharacterized membrane protein YoaK (UPF0700 family)|nr:DUF1275 domain-containing protein [Bacillota bacterium]
MAESNRDIKEEYYLVCEKRWVFSMLMLVAGFYGAFTYSIRGGIFCNAQTANFVLFAMALGSFQWKNALYYLIPMAAYLLGAIVSEAVPNYVKKTHIIRWDTLLILIEMVAVVILGFLPETAPFQISQITINFICSMQYNTFRQAQGVPMATTFCTNHLRQIGIAIVKGARNSSDENHVKRMKEHVKMLILFVIGATISAMLCNIFLGKAIWFALIPLTIVFSGLLYADRKIEQDMIEATPKGH